MTGGGEIKHPKPRPRERKRKRRVTQKHGLAESYNARPDLQKIMTRKDKKNEMTIARLREYYNLQLLRIWSWRKESPKGEREWVMPLKLLA